MRISIEKECGTGFSRPLVVQMNPVLRGEGETLPLVVGAYLLGTLSPFPATAGSAGVSATAFRASAAFERLRRNSTA